MQSKNCGYCTFVKIVPRKNLFNLFRYIFKKPLTYKEVKTKDTTNYVTTNTKNDYNWDGSDIITITEASEEDILCIYERNNFLTKRFLEKQ